MIDFDLLTIKTKNNTKYSFVGIEKKENQILFHVPKGFENSPQILNTFERKRDLFFLLHNVFYKFKSICINKQSSDKNINVKTQDREGIFDDLEGLQINVANEESIVFYSKLSSFSTILSAFDELKINALIAKLGKSKRIDYKKSFKYLNKGIFLDNGAVFFNIMSSPKKYVNKLETDIILLYCYILTEIKKQLKEVIRPELAALSENFVEKYNLYGYSLFQKDTWKDTLNILKDTFELINHYTSLKDTDYWCFYEAIEKFLFGSIASLPDGYIWGINNFHSVWESICLTYCLSRSRNRYLLIYLDDLFVSDQIINSRKVDFYLPNLFEVNKRSLRPDFVTLAPDMNDYLSAFNNKIIRIDPKYVDWNDGNYFTRIDYTLKLLNRDEITLKAKTAYRHQRKAESTYSSLMGEKLGIFKGGKTESYYFSYWNLKSLNLLDYYFMFHLNHIFFIAFFNKLIDKDSFFKYFKNRLGNVFESSFMRTVNNLKSTAYYTTEQFYNQYTNSFKINVIDFKYKTLDYYQKQENQDEIKTKDVRKQFVYEYLLQAYFQQRKHPLKNFKIKSEFWIPAYSENKPILSLAEVFMDDYIELIEVNPIKIMEHYIQ